MGYSAFNYTMQFAFLLLMLSSCDSFNVDINNFIQHSSRQSESMFGYSIALYNYKDQISLLVGAPKYTIDHQPGVNQSGAVFKCDDPSRRYCRYIPFDDTGDRRNLLQDPSVPTFLESKSHQHFGATVRASEDGRIVVACAPRYVYFTETSRKREPVGKCLIAADGFSRFEEYSPCRSSGAWGYNKKGSCQAGFDAAITKDGGTMFVGAPGAYYWQGQVHSQRTTSLLEKYHAMTLEGQATEDDQYLGYSVAAGEFNGDDIQDVAIGVPKGLNYTGKIAIYSRNFQWIRNITGDQMGSYFGYCLAVMDFNNDGRDDIIVGSPMYTDYEDREMKIEVGRIHILLQNSVHRFEERINITGTKNRARFGLSVAAIGDINLDGFKDIAVGAPYWGDEGEGAVFIFHGFSDISKGKFFLEKDVAAQVIKASSFSRGLRTFGWSLSGGLDIDGNSYPDLSVGAYESNSVFLFKSRPIIKFTRYQLSFETAEKTIDIETPNCRIRGSDGYTCVKLKFCLAYDGVNVGGNIDLQVEYTLDEGRTLERRLLFENNGEDVFRERLQYQKNTEKCRILQTFVKGDLVDKLNPISAKVKYSLIEAERISGALTPVLNMEQKLTLYDSITIRKNCGPDNICIPDLRLTFNAPDEFVLGRNETLSTDIRVVNSGEDAFEAVVYISEPKGLLFKKFVAGNNETITWSMKDVDGRSFIKVDLGNPLPKGQDVAFTVMFQHAGALEEPRFHFLVTANSTNTEGPASFKDNVIKKVIEAKIEADITLYGSSNPESIVYNKTLYQVPLRSHEKHIGPSLVHTYGLLSKGPSDVDEVEIVIVWPSRTQDGHHLLYLMEQPKTDGNVNCDFVPDVNPLNYEVLTTQEKKKMLGLSYLETKDEASTSYVDTSSSSASSSSGGSSYRGGGVSGHEYSSSSSSGSSHSSSSSTGYFYNESSSSSTSGGSFSRSQTVQGGSHRSRRDTQSTWERLATDCGATTCTRIICRARNLVQNDDVYIYIRSRLFIDTLEEYKFKDAVSITARMATRAQISSMGIQADELKVSSLNVTTTARSAKSLDEAPPIPWWVILLATLAGLLILLILILILWKCGYFKRHRPRHKARVQDDAQPLNPVNGSNGPNASSNGHSRFKYSNRSNRPFYPGDEAL